jgi:hypothetical protein
MSAVAAATTLAVGAYSANRASKAAQNAANTSANAQLEAARIGADVQRFKPVGITTRFGRSQFGFDPEGNLQSAGYTATPEITALQDRVSGLYNLSLGQAEQAVGLQPGISQQAQGLFNLGQGYLAESPEQARQRFMNQQYALLDPVRQREEDRLGAGVFGRGRAGLNIGDIGQPELFALASARRQQDLELARQAEAASQQQIGFGTGLLGQGLNLQQSGYGLQSAALGPFQSQFGLDQLLEQTAQQPLDIGAQLGGRSAQAGANVGQTLLAGGQNAAQLRMQGSLVGPTLQYNTLSDLVRNPQLQQGIQGLFANDKYLPNFFSGRTANTYNTNPLSQQTGMLAEQDRYF